MAYSNDQVFRLSIAMIILTGLSVFLRFLLRAHSKVSFGAEDWWVLSSLVFYYTYMALQIWIATDGALELPVSPATIPTWNKTLKLAYVATPLSVATTATAKISILCLYRRIFTTKSFRRASLIVGLGVFLYWLAATVGVIFQCSPVRGAWQLTTPSKCINFAAFFLGLELVNDILDILMLSLPLRVIPTLQLGLHKRLQLAAMFLLGGLVLLSGIARMAVIYRAGNETLSAIADLIWATIENGLAIICACLPTYGPLLSKSWSLVSNVNSWRLSFWNSTQLRYGSQATPKNPSQDDHSERRNLYDRIGDGDPKKSHLTNAVGGLDVEDRFIAGRDYPLHSINVQSTTEVV